MERQDSFASASSDDKRQVFAQLHEHSVAIASLQSGVESLASSTESGFRNITNRIDDLGQSLRSQRPQLGVIATIVASTCALVGGLAGFALKSSTLPLERDIRWQEKFMHTEHTMLTGRVVTLEEQMRGPGTRRDESQDARLDTLEKVVLVNSGK